MNILFANNATTTLATSITSSDTSVTLASGTGVLFPNPTVGQEYFLLSLTDAATKTLNEIVQCTARSADVLTIVRSQEGTTARAWNAGDIAQNNWTAGSPFDLNFTQLVTNAGNPNGAVEGVLNELCVDTIYNVTYLCTTPGTSVTAVWTMMPQNLGGWKTCEPITGNYTSTGADSGKLFLWDGNGTFTAPPTSELLYGARVGVYKNTTDSGNFAASSGDVFIPHGNTSIAVGTMIGEMIFTRSEINGNWLLSGDLALGTNNPPAMQNYMQMEVIYAPPRVANTIYTNTSTKLLCVSVSVADTGTSVTCTANLNINSGAGISAVIANGGYNGLGESNLIGFVSPGAQYSVTLTNMAIQTWLEAY